MKDREIDLIKTELVSLSLFVGMVTDSNPVGSDCINNVIDIHEYPCYYNLITRPEPGSPNGGVQRVGRNSEAYSHRMAAGSPLSAKLKG